MSLVLLTICSALFGPVNSPPWHSHWQTNVCWHKLSADPLLSHASMTSYGKSLMFYTQAYHRQVKEVFPDPSSKFPVGHSLPPGDSILEKPLQEYSFWTPQKGIFPSAPNQWHYYSTRRCWVLDTHLRAKEGISWHQLLYKYRRSFFKSVSTVHQ